jgi:hypothetical protein
LFGAGKKVPRPAGDVLEIRRRLAVWYGLDVYDFSDEKVSGVDDTPCGGC